MNTYLLDVSLLKLKHELPWLAERGKWLKTGFYCYNCSKIIICLLSLLLHMLACLFSFSLYSGPKMSNSSAFDFLNSEVCTVQ